MIDHIFLSVSEIGRSVAFYTAALAPLGVTVRLGYDGNDGPPGHPDLKGFGANGRIFFWLREGDAAGGATHVGFVANSTEYTAAMSAGAADNGAPGARLYYAPRYYAACVIDPYGYTLGFVYKSWQHTSS